MPKFTIEITHLVPNYIHRTVEATDFAAASAAALAMDDDSWKLDWECARPDFISGAWEGEKPYEGADIAPAPSTIAAGYPVDAPPQIIESPERLARSLLTRMKEIEGHFPTDESEPYGLLWDAILDEVKAALPNTGEALIAEISPL